jgi:cell division protein DivIC
MLMVIMLGQGINMRKKIATNNERLQSVEKQIKEENQRTKEIEELQEYMKSDEYAEKTAKEKIGLVKDNEIIFKETD